jgi:YhcH/YjgK/YiaL family protein
MIIDKLANIDIYKGFSKRLAHALQYISETDFSEMEIGRHDICGSEIFVLVNDYETKENDSNIMEAHKKHIDLHYIFKGSEIIEYEAFDNQVKTREYDAEHDYLLFTPKIKTRLILSEGMFAIFYPKDLHLPGLINNKSEQVRKIVVKILID